MMTRQRPIPRRQPLPLRARRVRPGGPAVPVTARMELVHQAPVLDVTEADLARGHVDLPAGTRLRVSTTGCDAYRIELVPKLPIFTACMVHAAGEVAELGPEGGMLVQRGRPSQHHETELSFRFVLARDLEPGRYRFPLHVLVQPL